MILVGSAICGCDCGGGLAGWASGPIGLGFSYGGVGGRFLVCLVKMCGEIAVPWNSCPDWRAN